MTADDEIVELIIIDKNDTMIRKFKLYFQLKVTVKFKCAQYVVR